MNINIEDIPETYRQTIKKIASKILPDLRHYTRGNAYAITPSLSELYDEKPNKAKKILNDFIEKGERRERYLEDRKTIEDYMRSKIKRLGITPKHRYPTYALLDLDSAANTIFGNDQSITLPLQALANNTTFTIGDSFPVLAPKVVAGSKRYNTSLGNDLITLEELTKLYKSGELHKQLNNIHKEYLAQRGNAPMPYVEAQIWENPEVLDSLIKHKKRASIII